MGKKEHNLKKETLLQALENSLGIVSTACNRSGISRSSFYKWYHEDEEFRKKVDEIDNIKLDFDKSAKLSIAKKAKTLGTNARGLKNILDRVLLPFQFDAHEMKNKGVTTIKITGDVVDNNADPVLLFKKQDGTISKKQSV